MFRNLYLCQRYGIEIHPAYRNFITKLNVWLCLTLALKDVFFYNDMLSSRRIPIFIQGTPMRFLVNADRVAVNDDSNVCYVPGKIFKHQDLGYLRTEEIIIDEEGDIVQVICSIHGKSR